VARRALLIALSFLVSAAFCEGLLRLVWTNPYRHELPERVTPLRMHHGLRELPIDRHEINPQSPKGLLRTDERAYILPSRRFAKPDATIVFLGGSTTECAALDEDARFPALVSKLLEAKGLRADVLNAGVSGNTTQDALELLLDHVSDDKPDVAVLMEAANDYGVLLQDGSYRSRGAQLVNTGTALRWPLQLASSHVWLIGALRSYLTLGSVLKSPPADPNASLDKLAPTEEYAKRLRAFAGLCRAFGIVPVLMTQPSAAVPTPDTPRWVTARNQDAFNDVIRQVASDERVALIDLARHVEQDVAGYRDPMKIFYDGIHVSAEGSQVYAEFITQRLLETALAKSGALRDHDEEPALAAPAHDGAGLGEKPLDGVAR
jgi:lysophospholipase L1-like esterase